MRVSFREFLSKCFGIKSVEAPDCWSRISLELAIEILLKSDLRDKDTKIEWLVDTYGSNRTNKVPMKAV